MRCSKRLNTGLDAQAEVDVHDLCGSVTTPTPAPQKRESRRWVRLQSALTLRRAAAPSSSPHRRLSSA
ncbi:hypothetical protein VP06_04285 [Methylobacterium aquaticum]|uniref:Uncharacterized protein n=1 Tax=Methylobacterium aquaticum TaxID=270351 RepID=A0A0J6SVQ5_9HYPH|nr:hypothetical protein VP06_04285 [Methylobacterium aquaticum]